MSQHHRPAAAFVCRRIRNWLRLATTRVSPPRLLAFVGLTVFFLGVLREAHVDAADLLTLTAENWDDIAPRGKEVDAIYGDYVLRNEHVVVVVGRPVAGRNANMSVRSVGGSIIDFTRRAKPNDQLTAYFPGGARFTFTKPTAVRVGRDGEPLIAQADPQMSGASVVLECVADPADDRAACVTRYTLTDGAPYLVVETILSNPGTKPLTEDLADAVRADRMFELSVDTSKHLFTAHDDWFGQSYGVLIDDYELSWEKVLVLHREGNSKVTLPPGGATTIRRRLFVGDHALAVLGQVARVRETPVRAATFKVFDPAGPVAHAQLELLQDGKRYGLARTDSAGSLSCDLPPAPYQIVVRAQGRPAVTRELVVGDDPTVTASIPMEACGYVVGKITDAAGRPIPAKVAFFEKGQPRRYPRNAQGKYDPKTVKPYFGPDAGERAIHNLVYTENGTFRQEIDPGSYEVVVSYGIEYDVAIQELTVTRGQEATLAAKLPRSVDTAGWISGDFHNHSTPSGDNVSSQLGRVLNLLCEHIEFAPCTEHNRIDSYVPHLRQLAVEHLMATCSGMELTGSPLPVDHQNAFPLVMKPRTQDGGGPQADVDPVVQIERLVMWDNKSDKLVQENHPNLVQIWGDKDLDGVADGGFAKMLNFMDVMEVHPLHSIFAKTTPDKKGGPAVFHWLQTLNAGFRIPGVVNTDAHYNFHGSGWLRNYLKSDTDDPARVKTLDMVHAAEKGHVTMTNGPFLDVELVADVESTPAARGRGISGDTVVAPGGKAQLRVRVQCANWLDVDRVQVFLNGRPVPELNFTRRTHPDRFADGVLKFSAHLPLALAADTHIVVATIQEGGDLEPWFGPAHEKMPPCAVSNPIFVDLDGKGFEPNGDQLDFPLPQKK